MKDEMNTNITFSGKEPSEITFKELEELIGLFDGDEPAIHHILENCTKEQLESVFGKKVEGGARDVLFGLPIYERKFVPLGEVWLMDKDGKSNPEI